MHIANSFAHSVMNMQTTHLRRFVHMYMRPLIFSGHEDSIAFINFAGERNCPRDRFVKLQRVGSVNLYALYESQSEELLVHHGVLGTLIYFGRHLGGLNLAATMVRRWTRRERNPP